jgi:hypothetical protein
MLPAGSMKRRPDRAQDQPRCPAGTAPLPEARAAAVKIDRLSFFSSWDPSGIEVNGTPNEKGCYTLIYLTANWTICEAGTRHAAMDLRFFPQA